jgi:Zn-dependent peptidase ImmA (M78 family)/transcriptional regulator with XRE-family HTH domain
MTEVGWAELGQRIAAAREARGLSQGMLAELAGLNQSVISRMETGKRPISSLELVDIADSLRVSVLELLNEAGQSRDLALAARVAEASRPASVERALARARDILGIQQMLDELGMSRTRAERLSYETPSGSAFREGAYVASQVRLQLGLGNEPIAKLADLAEERFGVDVALEPLPEGVDGLSINTAQSALILVDSDPVYGRQRFTMAHELGHYIFGDAEPSLVDEGLGFASRLDREQRANSFAAHFLMPLDSIRAAAVEGRLTEEACLDLAFTYGISLEAFTWHAQKSRIIDHEFARYLRAAGPKQLAFRYGRVADWEETQLHRRIIRAPSRILHQAFDAYQLGIIGIGPISVLMIRSNPEALRTELASSGISPHARDSEDGVH